MANANANQAALNPAADAKQFDNLLLNEGLLGTGAFGTSRNDALQSCTGILEKYQGDTADLDTLLDKIGASGLENFASQMDASGVLGANGLSQDQKTQLFSFIAQNADGSHSAAFMGDLGRDDQDLFGQAMAQSNVPAQAKLDFINSIKNQTTKSDDALNTFAGGYSITVGNEAARAVGYVLGSLSGNDLTNALARLDDNQLGAVMKAAERETITTTTSIAGWLKNPSQSVTVSFDTTPLVAIMQAAATADVTQKARVFEDAAKALDDINSTNTALSDVQSNKVLNAMIKLLQSDTKGVVGELSILQSNEQALSDFMTQLLAEAQEADLGYNMKQLQQGNGLSHDPLSYLDQLNKDARGDLGYRNSENRGYFVGAIEAAIQKTDSSANSGIK